MKKQRSIYFITLFLLVLSTEMMSQTRAVTENGDTIYVYNNGTWSFEELEQMPQVDYMDFLSSELKIDTINSAFNYSSNAKKEVKNAFNLFTIKYDDKLWERIPPATLNDEAEFAFQSKTSDIWCIVISEQTPIASDNLFRIAKKTMEENTGAQTQIIKTELRLVNGTQIIRGVLHAEISGISFIFDSYYYSNDLGSVQFTTYTSDNVWEKNEDEILKFLNGFVVE